MKNKKRVAYLQALLHATLVTCFACFLFVWVASAMTGKKISEIPFFLSDDFPFILLLSGLAMSGLFIKVYILMLDGIENEQAAKIASVDTYKLINGRSFEFLPKGKQFLYKEILENMSDDEWQKICEKYDRLYNNLKQKAQEDIDKHNDEITKLKNNILEKLK